MKGYFIRLLPMLAAMSIILPCTAHALIVTIVHPDVSINAISRGDLKEIYYGKLRRWPDGNRVIPVIYQESSALAAYTQHNFSQSVTQFSTYWKRLVFTGRGSPPKSMSSADAVVDFVASNPGAIGFCPEEEVKEGVKRISVQ